MPTAPTSVFQDLAALSLYIFFAFFFVLVMWLHREGKREGYPLWVDRGGKARPTKIEGFPGVPDPKAFILPHGHGTVLAPGGGPAERDVTALLSPYDAHPGTSYDPVGDPMRDGLGAASYALRADTPDLDWDHGAAKIVPLRAAPGWHIPPEDPEIRGRALFGLDGKVAGTIVDLWVDKSDVLLRYAEAEITGTGRRVLIPLGVLSWWGEGPVKCDTATAAQIAAAPGTAQPERVTLREEDVISGYFGGGERYALPGKNESYA
jgi:photosynthetic reaction center H subunit